MIPGFFSGCSTSPAFIATSPQPVPAPAKQQKLTQAQILHRFHTSYAQFQNRDSLKKAYVFLQQIPDNDSSDFWYDKKLSELSFYFATYTNTGKDSSKLIYNQGKNAAHQIIQHAPDVQDYIENGKGKSADLEKDTLADTTKVAAVYWWTVNSMLWLMNEPPITRMVARKRLQRAIQFIKETAPDYRHGAVERLQGLLLTISPDGDLNEAKQNFEKAITTSNTFLENRFFYGRFYAVTLQDKSLFMTQMQQIVDYVVSDTSRYQKINMLVQQRAGDFIHNQSTLFSGNFPTKIFGEFSSQEK